MRIIFLVASVFFITACVTTRPANYFSEVPDPIEAIEEFNVQVSSVRIPVLVDYKKTSYSGVGAQSAAASFGVVGAVLGSLVESAVTESMTSSAKSKAEAKAASVYGSIRTDSIKPIIQSSAETNLSLRGKSVSARAGTNALKITPVVGLSPDASWLLLKLLYEVELVGDSATYKNHVIWQTRSDVWDNHSIEQAIDRGIAESVDVMIAELSGDYSSTDDIEPQKIDLYSPDRGRFKEKVQIIGWSGDRKNVRFKRQYSREIMSVSHSSAVYIHSGL